MGQRPRKDAGNVEGKEDLLLSGLTGKI